MEIQGEPFILDCYALPLDGFDIVLSVHWLKTSGPIFYDFGNLRMTFCHSGRTICWSGIGGSGARLNTLSSTCSVLTALLETYLDIFTEPTGLPPQRRHDHRIHLLPGIALVAVRPYRYPQLLKGEIERHCDAMLAQGIIRSSTSAFSSPVLLVCKHVKSWRFCVDFRALNELTVKDKFPISIVDELLDELCGASFFTKLDLRSGYHQVRMAFDDIGKTAFRTHQGHFEFLVMPFGLTNAPVTFQALMNDILKPFIRRFVLVFFDDILIYSTSWAEHLQHIKMLFQTLREHNLHLKQSKCSFGEKAMAYLGHVVFAEGVAMDASKVEAVQAWPHPGSVRAVGGFLELTGYYRKFIAGYGVVVAPLTALLKRDGFSWTDDAERAFLALKTALTTAPLLQLPNFNKRFIVDCDTSGSGFGAVLHQGDGAVAFFRRPVAAHHAKLPAYECELIGLVKAVKHWRPYLWGRAFTVRTDHFSLKYILDQRLSTIPQHTWVSKLFGYDLEVEYRPGRFNSVADALSRQDTVPADLAAISSPSFELFAALRQELLSNAAAQDIRAKLQEGSAPEGWTDVDGLLLFRGRVFVPDDSSLSLQLLSDAHGGHEGVQKTL